MTDYWSGVLHVLASLGIFVGLLGAIAYIVVMVVLIVEGRGKRALGYGMLAMALLFLIFGVPAFVVMS